MLELETPDGWTFGSSFLADTEFSGGGQGKGKQPREKIQGTQWRQKQEKIRNIPKVKWPKVINPFSKPK